jgi:hypothetical protein
MRGVSIGVGPSLFAGQISRAGPGPRADAQRNISAVSIPDIGRLISVAVIGSRIATHSTVRAVGAGEFIWNAVADERIRLGHDATHQ